MNLMIAKNEFDPYDALVGQLAIDSLQISWSIYQFKKSGPY